MVPNYLLGFYAVNILPWSLGEDKRWKLNIFLPVYSGVLAGDGVTDSAQSISVELADIRRQSSAEATRAAEANPSRCWPLSPSSAVRVTSVGTSVVAVRSTSVLVSSAKKQNTFYLSNLILTDFKNLLLRYITIIFWPIRELTWEVHNAIDKEYLLTNLKLLDFFYFDKKCQLPVNFIYFF